MASRLRPTRARQAPQRLGLFAEAEQLEKLGEQSSSEEEQEQGMSQEPAPAARAVKRSRPARRAGRAAGKATEGRPPSLADILCVEPVFDLMVQEDTIRNLPLVASDLAACITALGLRATYPSVAALWTGLASRHAQRMAAATAAAAAAPAAGAAREAPAVADQRGRARRPAPVMPAPAVEARVPIKLDGSVEAALTYLQVAVGNHCSRTNLLYVGDVKSKLHLAPRELKVISPMAWLCGCLPAPPGCGMWPASMHSAMWVHHTNHFLTAALRCGAGLGAGEGCLRQASCERARSAPNRPQETRG